MFLEPTELVNLTGRKQSKRQAEWLRSRRIKHHVNAQGRVMVKESWLDGGTSAAPVQPDFSEIA